MAARTTNKQEAIDALIKAGYTIIDTPSKKDIDLVVLHPSKPSERLDVKVYSRLTFIRRIHGSGLFVIFTHALTKETYLYPHDTLLKAFPNILKTESWLSESGMYNFRNISEKNIELIRKYRL